MRISLIWVSAIALTTPVLGQNLLPNGDFTELTGPPRCDEPGAPAELTEVPADWTSSRPEITSRYIIDGEGILTFMFDECPGGPNADGFYAALKTGNQLDASVHQTVTTGITPGSSYKLTGHWGAASMTHPNGSLRPLKISVRLRDGDQNGTVLSERSFIVGDTLANLDFDLTPLTPLVGVPSSSSVTIEWSGDNLVGDWSQAQAVYVDDLELTEETVCTAQPQMNSVTDSVTNQPAAPRGSTRTLTINGYGFVPTQTAVKLTRPGETDIPGTIGSESVSNITADFVLPADARVGRWHVQLDVAGCDSAIAPNAFEVYPPAFTNGSFDAQDVGPCTPTPGVPTDWQAKSDGHWGPGNELNLNGFVNGGTLSFLPSCPQDGQNYATSARLQGASPPKSRSSVFQTFAVTPGAQYAFSGLFAADGNNEITLRLLDGDTAAGMLSQQVLSNGPATFDWRFGFVTGKPTGQSMTAMYIVQQLGDPAPETALHADALAVELCVDEVTVSTVSVESAVNSGPIENVQITGSGFAGTPTVLLSKPGSSTTATSVQVDSPTQLTCAFDLTGLTSGRYDVIVKQGGCIDALPAALLVIGEAFVNGEFELPNVPQDCGPPPQIVAGTPTGWNFDVELLRDHNVWAPQCPRDNEPANGHYGSMTTGFGEVLRAWQTVAVEQLATYEFAGYFAGGGGNTVTISLVDGEIDGPELASTIVDAGSFSYPWTFASVSATAPGEVMTIVWEMSNTAGGANGSHADGLTFVQTFGCSDPFADADADGDIDGDDFGTLQVCYTGDATGHIPIPSDPQYCYCFDLDFDGDIDQTEVARFEQCAETSGPAIPADPGCDDP